MSLHDCDHPTLHAQVSVLQEQVRTLAWLHAELIHQMRIARLQNMLRRPEIQRQLQQALLGGAVEQTPPPPSGS